MLRSNSKSLGIQVVSPEEEKERLQWEGFPEKDIFKSWMKERVDDWKLIYNWHSAGSLGRPFPVLKYQYILKIKYTEAISWNSTRKLLWFEITKMLIAV